MNRYDSISNKISSDIFRFWKSKYNGKDGDIITYDDTFCSDIFNVDITARLLLDNDTTDILVDGFASYCEEGTFDDLIEIDIQVSPKNLPLLWKDISMNLKETVRHEMEHLIHGDGDNGKPDKYIKEDEYIRNIIISGLLPQYEYLKLDKEVDANIFGMYFRAKKEKRELKNIVNDYLTMRKLTDDQRYEVLKLWDNRISELGLKPRLI